METQVLVLSKARLIKWFLTFSLLRIKEVFPFQMNWYNRQIQKSILILLHTLLPPPTPWKPPMSQKTRQDLGESSKSFLKLGFSNGISALSTASLRACSKGFLSIALRNGEHARFLWKSQCTFTAQRSAPVEAHRSEKCRVPQRRHKGMTSILSSTYLYLHNNTHKSRASASYKHPW